MSEVIKKLEPASDKMTLVKLRPRPSYLAQVGHDLLGQWGAKLGITWVVLLIVIAVLAPFIANSHPLLMQDASSISSPLLKHLTAVDVILVTLGLLVIVLWQMKKRSLKKRWIAGISLGLIATILSLIFVHPPRAVVYSAYREGLASGEIDWAINAPIAYSASDRLRDQPDSRLHPPDRVHWLGTTSNGEDMLSRMIHATRIALAIGFIATGIALTVGVIVGGLMGYFSGIVDLIGMRLVEVFSAIPTIFLLIAFVAFYGRNLYLIMVVIGCTSWVGYAVFVRAEFLKLRQQDFVHAAVAAGLPLRSILFKHMLPNGITPILVSASFGVAGAILAETTLSFLGLGLVEEPSWGQLLNQAVSGSFYWWIAIFPGLAIFLTVFAYNLVGEAIRDAIDPHLKKASQL